MSERQQTIKKEIQLEGYGLHTGNKVSVRIKPAPAGHGVTFQRLDLAGTPVLKPSLDNITIDNSVPRCTTLGKPPVAIHTVEHFMAALYGVGIDNLFVELNGNELPGLDGSAIEFVRAFKEAGIVVQEADRQHLTVREPLAVTRNGASLLILPYDGFKISYTLHYDHPFLKSQYVSLALNAEVFEKELAPCRTFCLEEEARQLLSNGLGKGANYENTLVVGPEGVIKNRVRFDDEFARHKILDFLGDLFLLGRRVRGEVFAVKSGHALNIDLLKKLDKDAKGREQSAFVPSVAVGPGQFLSIEQIMKILPHRYPFLLVDRIVSLEPGKKAVGIKNLTINDNFFRGHFPARPIMPGVLMIEAMAQVGGVLVLTDESHRGKLALFMATDKVKFRKTVVPGDQLVMEVEMVRDRSRTANLIGKAKVAGEVVAEAELMFSYVDENFLD